MFSENFPGDSILYHPFISMNLKSNESRGKVLENLESGCYRMEMGSSLLRKEHYWENFLGMVCNFVFGNVLPLNMGGSIYPSCSISQLS